MVLSAFAPRRVATSRRWRLTFRRLASDALAALHAEQSAQAEDAVALIIDVACETRSSDYFRSEDPMEAAQFVVSDAVAELWELVRERYGFARFAATAAAQLPRWESGYGWSRSGWGRLAGKETLLATVLGRMLTVPDTWTVFADRYLEALDEIARAEAREPRSSRLGGGYPHSDYVREDRALHLGEWHALLVERLIGSEAEDRLDRLVRHSALDGPELTFVGARLAELRGDTATARELAQECLRRLPASPKFASFAVRVGAELPAVTRDWLAEQARFAVAMTVG